MTAVLLWPLLSALFTVPFLVWLYRRDGYLRLASVFVMYAAVFYAAGLVCFTLYPLPEGESGPGITYGITPILDPLNFIGDIQKDGMNAVLQLVFNVILFIPLGIIAKMLLKLGPLPTLVMSMVVTGLIETAQLTGLFGIYPYSYRTFEVDDLICNTLGGMVGWALGYLLVKWAPQASGDIAVTHHPGFVRRCVTLWTDLLIIEFFMLVPRLLLIAAAVLLSGGIDSIGDIPLAQVNTALFYVCFMVAFAIVEVYVPWTHDGSTPAGTFYRMSCETLRRTRRDRILFYSARAITLLILFLLFRFAVIPLLVFYVATRKMPYDFVPGKPRE